MPVDGQAATLNLNPPFNGPNRIILKSHGWREESIMDATIYPGMLLQFNTSASPVGTGLETLFHVIPHNTYGGRALGKFIAVEDAEQGNTIWQAPYAVGDAIPYQVCTPGDVMYVRIASGANITFQQLLYSDGAGHFVYNSNTSLIPVAFALEAVNNANGSGIGDGSAFIHAMIL